MSSSPDLPASGTRDPAADTAAAAGLARVVVDTLLTPPVVTTGPASPPRRLRDAVQLSADKLLPGSSARPQFSGAPVLVVLAAGRGTRFGQQPKCIQPILGTPLARHSIDAFRSVSTSPVVAVVGYRHDDVSAALGADNLFVLSENPTGGTAFAAFESLSVPGLLEANPLLVITMGDRVVPATTFRRLLEQHEGGGREADLTFLTARYEPPRHQGKGRVLRDAAGRVVRLVEQKDIAAESDPLTRQALESLTEGNCPLYAIRAATLFRHLGALDNANAQEQFYLTDVVAAIAGERGDIRTVTTSPTDSDYDLLCSDVTRPQDLALLEGILSRIADTTAGDGVERAAAAILADRPPGQVASIARQLQELYDTATRDKLGYMPHEPVAIGISGGRLRIAFMHPDMGRFFGPAWQMPIGAAEAGGNEQIVVLAQPADDGRLQLYPLDPKYRESVNFVAADDDSMYPGVEIADLHAYEGFGTRMSETLLLSLGYFTDEELETRKRKNQPLPPPSLRVSNNMRRPFALVGNAIASLRTLREGHLGARVQVHLDRQHFKGLRIACTGGIPQGGFSSSSALTVATKNALNSLYALDIPADLLVHLACQAEYGTGVRAGSLDQATEQKGRAGQGTLISSNPADNYRILGTYHVPADRFRVIFPYTVERDRAAWRWSWGQYAETSVAGGPLTTGEVRKMTGKAAEIAAILTRLPLDTDFFKEIEADLLADGQLDPKRRAWIAGILLQLPLLISREELQARVVAQRDWYAEELIRVRSLDPDTAGQKTDALFASLFAGWREPVLRAGRSNQRAAAGPRLGDVDGGETNSGGRSPAGPSQSVSGLGRSEGVPAISSPSAGSALPSPGTPGVPLRAMLAYLFGEVVTNFRLIHHPEEWIACVTRSQRGDCSVDIDPARLPDRAAMESELDWERGVTGPDRLNRWLERVGAAPYDFNQGLDDATLSVMASQLSVIRDPDPGVDASAAAAGVASLRPSASAGPSAFAGPTADKMADRPISDLPPSPSLWRTGRPPTPAHSSPIPENRAVVNHPTGNFFRGLALIDLAEAMLRRAFGPEAVAVRVNAAGQGDYFQAHVDLEKVSVSEVRHFLCVAFYRRFGLSPEPEFVETYPGAGAVGVTLSKYNSLPRLVARLSAQYSE
jgi:CTP:molybdopterin cytidylyltransferase MocA